jgi:hypothetical protein
MYMYTIIQQSYAITNLKHQKGKQMKEYRELKLQRKNTNATKNSKHQKGEQMKGYRELKLQRKNTNGEEKN